MVLVGNFTQGAREHSLVTYGRKRRRKKKEARTNEGRLFSSIKPGLSWEKKRRKLFDGLMVQYGVELGEKRSVDREGQGRAGEIGMSRNNRIRFARRHGAAQHSTAQQRQSEGGRRERLGKGLAQISGRGLKSHNCKLWPIIFIFIFIFKIKTWSQWQPQGRERLTGEMLRYR